eukprot:6568159-Lingulodinium_polyedra.AAC.1
MRYIPDGADAVECYGEEALVAQLEDLEKEQPTIEMIKIVEKLSLFGWLLTKEPDRQRLKALSDAVVQLAKDASKNQEEQLET